MITAEDAATFERCMAVGGFAVFPADTVYGLACDPDAKETVQRLHLLKRRSMDKPSAVMFFDAELALDTLTELEGPRPRRGRASCCPGAVTLLVPNPAHRFPLACGADPDTLGLRVPKLDTELRNVRWPVLQTSANFAGRPDPRRLAGRPARPARQRRAGARRRRAPGTPSTVIDLRDYANDRGIRDRRGQGLVARRRGSVAAAMSTAFVTGASGFIGGALTKRLVAEGWTVNALARSERSAQGRARARRRARSRATSTTSRR